MSSTPLVAFSDQEVIVRSVNEIRRQLATAQQFSAKDRELLDTFIADVGAQVIQGKRSDDEKLERIFGWYYKLLNSTGFAATQDIALFRTYTGLLARKRFVESEKTASREHEVKRLRSLAKLERQIVNFERQLTWRKQSRMRRFAGIVRRNPLSLLATIVSAAVVIFAGTRVLNKTGAAKKSDPDEKGLTGESTTDSDDESFRSADDTLDVQDVVSGDKPSGRSENASSDEGYETPPEE